MISAEETDYADYTDFLIRLRLALSFQPRAARRAEPWSAAGSDSATPPSEGISGGRTGDLIRERVAKAVSPLVPRSATALQGARRIPLASFHPIHEPILRDSINPRLPRNPFRLRQAR